MKTDEAIEMLRAMQNKVVDYAEMVGAPDFAYGCKYVYPEPEDYAIEEAIKALEEIQQYRVIGTVKECKVMDSIVSKVERNELVKIMDEWLKYSKIGTVEEFKKAMEKWQLKKPLLLSKKEKIMEGDYVHVMCPSCGEEIFSCFLFYPWNDSQRTHEFCKSCGQAIQWDDNLEGME